MTDAAALMRAQLAKASLSNQVDDAQQACIAAARTLAELARGHASKRDVDAAIDRALALSRVQLQLIVEAAEIDRRIEEAQAA